MPAKNKKTTRTLSIRPKTKKQQKPKKTPRINSSHELHSKFVRRVLTYSAFALLTIILTFLIFYRAKGYTFNKNGEVVRRGIVLVDSAPVNAKIFLDNKQVDTTEAKLEVNQGTHVIKLQADGYRTWERAFNMQPEKVLWFFYPYLIPSTLTSDQYITSQTTKQYSAVSDDGQIVGLSKSGQGGSQVLGLEKVDLTQDDPTRSEVILAVPANLFSRQTSGAYGDFKFVEWSPDGDSLLVQQTFDGKTELVNLRVNNPAESLNVTNSLKAAVTQAHYDEHSRLNLLVAEVLGIYDPKTMALQQTVASGLSGFQSFNNDVHVYSKRVNQATSNVYIQSGQGQPVFIANIGSGDPAQFDYKYIINRRVGYLALSSQANKELQIFKNPLQNQNGDAPQSALYLSTFTQLSSVALKASPVGSRQPGSYVALQLSSSRILVYDFEAEESFSYNLKATSSPEQLTGQNVEQELNIVEFEWLDPQHLQARTANGDIYYFDYDGNYLNLVANSNEGLSRFVRNRNSSFIVSNTSGPSTTITKIKFKK